MPVDLFVRKRLPDGGILVRFRRAFFGGEPLRSLLLGGTADLFDGELGGLRFLRSTLEVGAEAGKLGVDGRVRLRGLRGRNEGAGVELPVVAEAPLKPDTELPRHP